MNRSRKNRRPNANGIRPAFFAGAGTFAGTSRSMALLRNRSARQDFGNDLIRRDAFEVGLGLEQHAMAKNRRSCGFYIVGNHEIAAFNRGDGFSHQHQGDGRAWTRSQTDRGRITGRAHNGYDVIEKFRLDPNAPDFFKYRLQGVFGKRFDLYAVKSSRLKSVLVTR